MRIVGDRIPRIRTHRLMWCVLVGVAAIVSVTIVTTYRGQSPPAPSNAQPSTIGSIGTPEPGPSADQESGGVWTVPSAMLDSPPNEQPRDDQRGRLDRKVAVRSQNRRPINPQSTVKLQQSPVHAGSVRGSGKRHPAESTLQADGAAGSTLGDPAAPSGPPLPSGLQAQPEPSGEESSDRPMTGQSSEELSPAGVAQQAPVRGPSRTPVLTAPVPVSVEPPKHPGAFRVVVEVPGLSAGVRIEAASARVRLRLHLRSDGGVEDVSIAVPSGYPDLDGIAAQAARSWRFLPARRDGAAITSVVLIWVAFVMGP
jgi:TonB family protein